MHILYEPEIYFQSRLWEWQSWISRATPPPLPLVARSWFCVHCATTTSPSLTRQDCLLLVACADWACAWPDVVAKAPLLATDIPLYAANVYLPSLVTLRTVFPSMPPWSHSNQVPPNSGLSGDAPQIFFWSRFTFGAVCFLRALFFSFLGAAFHLRYSSTILWQMPSGSMTYKSCSHQEIRNVFDKAFFEMYTKHRSDWIHLLHELDKINTKPCSNSDSDVLLREYPK